MASGAEQGHDYARGVVYVLIATLGWSVSGLFVRLLPGLDGWQLNCWRGGSMAVALMIYLLVVYRRRTLAKFAEVPMFALVTCAFFFTVGSTLYVTSLTLAPTANVSCLTAVAPIFTAIVSRLFTGERTGADSLAAAALALAGVAVIVHEGLETGYLLGAVTSLLTAFSFACQTVILRHYRNYDVIPAMVVGGITTFLVAGAFGGFQVPLPAIGVLSVMGPVQLAMPIIFYAAGARFVPATSLSLVALMDVVLNPFWSWLGTGETPEPSTYLGGTMIVTAVALAILGGRRALRRQMAR